MIRTCKLCQKELELLKKSHIIPNFMYKDLFDDKHKYIVTTNSDIKKKTNNFSQEQSGIYEQNLLCRNCDNNILSNLERYASNFFLGKNLSIEKSPILKRNFDLFGNEFFNCSNADYNKLKLFFLSILWRSSISKNKFFKDIELGPHEEKIRKLIWENDAGNIDNYPVLLSLVHQSKGSPNTFIGQPRLSNYKGHKVASFWIASIMFIVLVSSHSKPNEFLEMSLKPDGSFYLPYLSKNKAWELMIKFSGLIN